MEWPRWTPEERMARLTPPASGEKIAMVLDTDTYNEVDDQFALAYSLLSPERLDVRAVYAAPFLNDRSTGAGDGMEKSYAEIVRLLAALGRSAEGFAHRGSGSFLPDERTPVRSAAAEDLVDRASRMGEEPLYVVAIGAITNVASALLLDPSITRKIVVVWLGGQPLHAPDTREFNLSQDVAAARVVLDSGVPMVLVPCTGVASHMLTTVPELRQEIAGKNAICDALFSLFCAYNADHFAWAKEIWDVSAVGYVINPEWVPTVLQPAPVPAYDSRWSLDPRRHLIRVAQHANRNAIFADMFRKLAAGQ